MCKGIEVRVHTVNPRTQGPPGWSRTKEAIRVISRALEGLGFPVDALGSRGGRFGPSGGSMRGGGRSRIMGVFFSYGL